MLNQKQKDYLNQLLAPVLAFIDNPDPAIPRRIKAMALKQIQVKIEVDSDTFIENKSEFKQYGIFQQIKKLRELYNKGPDDKLKELNDGTEDPIIPRDIERFLDEQIANKRKYLRELDETKISTAKANLKNMAGLEIARQAAERVYYLTGIQCDVVNTGKNNYVLQAGGDISTELMQAFGNNLDISIDQSSRFGRSTIPTYVLPQIITNNFFQLQQKQLQDQENLEIQYQQEKAAKAQKEAELSVKRAQIRPFVETAVAKLKTATHATWIVEYSEDGLIAEAPATQKQYENNESAKYSEGLSKLLGTPVTVEFVNLHRIGYRIRISNLDQLKSLSGFDNDILGYIKSSEPEQRFQNLSQLNDEQLGKLRQQLLANNGPSNVLAFLKLFTIGERYTVFLRFQQSYFNQIKMFEQTNVAESCTQMRELIAALDKSAKFTMYEEFMGRHLNIEIIKMSPYRELYKEVANQIQPQEIFSFLRPLNNALLAKNDEAKQLLIEIFENTPPDRLAILLSGLVKEAIPLVIEQINQRLVQGNQSEQSKKVLLEIMSSVKDDDLIKVMMEGFGDEARKLISNHINQGVDSNKVEDKDAAIETLFRITGALKTSKSLEPFYQSLNTEAQKQLSHKLNQQLRGNIYEQKNALRLVFAISDQLKNPETANTFLSQLDTETRSLDTTRKQVKQGLFSDNADLRESAKQLLFATVTSTTPSLVIKAFLDHTSDAAKVLMVEQVNLLVKDPTKSAEAKQFLSTVLATIDEGGPLNHFIAGMSEAAKDLVDAEMLDDFVFDIKPKPEVPKEKSQKIFEIFFETRLQNKISEILAIITTEEQVRAFLQGRSAKSRLISNQMIDKFISDPNKTPEARATFDAFFNPDKYAGVGQKSATKPSKQSSSTAKGQQASCSTSQVITTINKQSAALPLENRKLDANTIRKIDLLIRSSGRKEIPKSMSEKLALFNIKLSEVNISVNNNGEYQVNLTRDQMQRLDSTLNPKREYTLTSDVLRSIYEEVESLGRGAELAGLNDFTANPQASKLYKALEILNWDNSSIKYNSKKTNYIIKVDDAYLNKIKETHHKLLTQEMPFILTPEMQQHLIAELQSRKPGATINTDNMKEVLAQLNITLYPLESPKIEMQDDLCKIVTTRKDIRAIVAIDNLQAQMGREEAPMQPRTGIKS